MAGPTWDSAEYAWDGTDWSWDSALDVSAATALLGSTSTLSATGQQSGGPGAATIRAIPTLVAAGRGTANAGATIRAIPTFVAGARRVVGAAVSVASTSTLTATATSGIATPPSDPPPRGGVILRLTNPNGGVYGYLPDHTGLQIQEELNGPGSITFSYLNNGERANTISNDNAYIRVIDGGVERNDIYMLEDDGDDPASDAGDARPISVAGRGVMAILERAIVYPREHHAGDPLVGMDPHFSFVEPDLDDHTQEPPHFPTPGRIMNVLINRAHERGAIPEITTDFNEDVDSDGAAWPEDYTVTYDAGITLLAVLQAMTDQGWADARMNGFTLQMYVPDTFLRRDRPNVIFRRGREVLSGPRKRSRRNVRSHILAIGDEGAAAHAADTTALARYGRREGFLGQGGMTALDTLDLVANKTLKLFNKTAEGFTVEIEATSGGPAVTSYRLGDLIRYDQRRLNETEYEPLRIRTIATTWDEVGNKQISLELNDLFVERSIRLARKIEGIVNGSTNNVRPPTPPPHPPDRIEPKAPASVSVSSGATTKRNGEVVATATVSWPDVTQNEDGSVFDDFGYYVVQMLYPDRASSDWTAGQQVHQPPVAYYQDLPPGERVRFRVRTVDATGNKSDDWTESPNHTLATDSDPPPRPGLPSVQSVIGGIRVGWDGLGAFGEPMPVDFSHTIVHMSTAGTGFDVSDATRAATFRTRGFVTLDGLVSGTTYYFRLQTVDRNDNASAPSDTVSSGVGKVVSDDLAARIIRLGALADIERASVTTTFLSTFETADDRWARRSGVGATMAVATVPDAALGSGVARFSGMTGGATQWEFTDNIPYDPDQLYRVQIRVRTTNTPAAGDTFRAGIAGISYDGITRVSAANTQTGQDHFVAAHTQAPPATVGQWQTYTGFMKGREVGAAVSSAAAPNPTFVPIEPTLGPRKVAGSLKYMRPTVMFLGSGATQWEIDQFTVEMLEIPPNIIGTVQIANATVVNAKIADAAIDDAKIGHLEVTTLQSGNLMADTVIVDGQLRTADATDGSSMVFDALGLRAKKGTAVTFKVDAPTGDVTVKGEMQTGTDGGPHVSIKAGVETWTPAGGTSKTVDLGSPGNPAIALFSGVNPESQPALIQSQFTTIEEDTTLRPVLRIVSGKRGADGERTDLRLIGGSPGGDRSRLLIRTAKVEIMTPGADAPEVYIRNASGAGTANAPLTIGQPGFHRLLLSNQQIRAVSDDPPGGGDGPEATLLLNDGTGPVQLANRLIVRPNPDNNNAAQCQILPVNTDHATSIVFGQATVHVMNRTAGGWQSLKVQDLIHTGQVSAGIMGAARTAGGSFTEPVDPEAALADVAGIGVVDTDQPGNRPTLRGVDPSTMPAILQDGDEANPGIRIAALTGTLAAAQQAVIARLDALTAAEADLANRHQELNDRVLTLEEGQQTP